MRIQAYRALGDAGDPAVLEPLAAALAIESDPTARVAGQHALGRLNADEALLVNTLASSPTPIARAWAADQLGRVHTPTASEALLAAVGDESELVRGEVFEALASSSDPRALRALSRAAVRDPSPTLRAAAEQAAIRSVRAPSADVPTDIALLQSDDPTTRAEAAARLGASADWRAVDPLLHAAKTADTETRKAALLAMGALGDHRAVPELTRIAEDQSGQVRYHAIAALAHIGDESSVEPLTALTRSTDTATRQLAARALGWINAPGTAARLEGLVQDPSEDVRAELLAVLGEIDDPGRVGVLTRMLQDASPFVRAEAARVLAATGDASAGPALTPLLRDADPLVRLSAADGLAKLGYREALPALIEARDRAREGDERAALGVAVSALGG